MGVVAGKKHSFFFLVEWEFRGNSLQSWYHPPGIRRCKNRVLEEECERVSGGYVQMKFSGFLSMKRKTSFSFFCLNSFIEVKSILHTRDIFNVYNLMRSDICKQL